ncbi:YheC/YheD family protein [Niallia sp. XMNu-256]|uniref:YheC/YheD family protein n=1 Tax=Niallia sp. XMNu-256 TaxID=3082444 RepID=UPI0030D258E5
MKLSKGKWSKYKLMKDEKELSLYLPETKLFSAKNLWNMIRKYNEVIIKPSHGSNGKGVIQVTSKGESRYEIHVEKKKIILQGKNQTVHYLIENHLSNKKIYIVQQRIPLATINNSPFDLRVMVQRKKKSYKWSMTGIAAKVALDGYFVTNMAQKILPIEQAIQSSNIAGVNVSNLLNKIHRISLITAKQLEKFYPHRRTLGLDIAIDKNGKLWIIEVNLEPSIFLFNFLEDKTIIEKIRAFNRR